jgi:LexA-binding, inner membrane-associated putative hydrolase
MRMCPTRRQHALTFRQMHPYHRWPFLTSPEHPTLSALWAVLIHGCISLFVVVPIVLRSRKRVTFAVLACIGGPAVDLDHVFAAESLHPTALETLKHRPDTYSLLLAVALAVVAFAVTRSKPITWSVFAIVVSHLLIDAAGGNEYCLYPLTHPSSIPWLACPIGLAVLFAMSVLVGRTRPSVPQRHPVDGPTREESGAPFGEPDPTVLSARPALR